MRIEDGPWHVAPSISLDGTTAIDPSFWTTHLPVSHEAANRPPQNWQGIWNAVELPSRRIVSTQRVVGSAKS